MSNIVCENKVFYDNQYNYRYIVTTYKNGFQIVQIIAPFRGCWKKQTTLRGFNIYIV